MSPYCLHYFPSFPKFYETFYDLISLVPYFSPSTPSVKLEELLHGLRGKNKDTGGKISHIFPQLDFCALFSVTIKIIEEKNMILYLYCLHFFPSLWNIVLSLSFCHFSFSLSFLSFSPFFVVVRVVFMIFFPPQAIFIPHGGGGGGFFPKYIPL